MLDLGNNLGSCLRYIYFVKYFCLIHDIRKKTVKEFMVLILKYFISVIPQTKVVGSCLGYFILSNIFVLFIRNKINLRNSVFNLNCFRAVIPQTMFLDLGNNLGSCQRHTYFVKYFCFSYSWDGTYNNALFPKEKGRLLCSFTLSVYIFILLQFM